MGDTDILSRTVRSFIELFYRDVGMERNFSLADILISNADSMLRTLFAPPVASRPTPAKHIVDKRLSERDKDESSRLMRVNHTGEVCAQALYQGQALTAREPHLRSTFLEASDEENDHLAWCDERIGELGGRTSLLNPLFYTGSFAMGALAGLIGDRTSAAFLAETEHQVAKHLDRHITRLPVADKKSSAILTQMKEDELKHAKAAEKSSGGGLPDPVRELMKGMSKIMTGTSYWI